MLDISNIENPAYRVFVDGEDCGDTPIGIGNDGQIWMMDGCYGLHGLLYTIYPESYAAADESADHAMLLSARIEDTIMREINAGHGSGEFACGKHAIRFDVVSAEF